MVKLFLDQVNMTHINKFNTFVIKKVLQTLSYGSFLENKRLWFVKLAFHYIKTFNKIFFKQKHGKFGTYNSFKT